MSLSRKSRYRTTKTPRWIAFDLDAKNRAIACKTLGIQEADIEPLRRILRVI